MSKTRGFTLIELLVAMAIVAVIGEASPRSVDRVGPGVSRGRVGSGAGRSNKCQSHMQIMLEAELPTSREPGVTT